MAFEFKLPDIGEGVVEGEIVSWLVKPGDVVEEDQPMVEVMTDKATVEIPSPVAGTIAECRGDEGDIVPVGAVLVVIDPDDGEEPDEGDDKKATAPQPEETAVADRKQPAEQAEPAQVTPPETVAEPDPRPQPRAGGRVKATPAVRKLAREQGVDLETVNGTGPGGRITRDDVLGIGGQAGRPQPAAAAAREEPIGPTETLPYRGLRRRIGQQMSRSKLTAPHFTYVEEVDVTELVEMRRRFNESHPDQKVTYLPFIMKAVVSGLGEFPIVNSVLDEDKGEIELRRYYNLGIATATDDGLIVPVLKDVDSKTIVQLSAELARVSEEARQGRASLDDLQGSTFTITSLGALGGIMATPIINYPEVAILGVHKIVSRPVVREGEVIVREMMNLSISLDHRVVDGHVGAMFLQHVVRLIEDPGLLLIG